MSNNHQAIPSTGIKTTFDLQFPVSFQGTTYTRITMRRPKVKDTRLLVAKAENDAIGAQSDFLAQLAQVPPGVFEELDLEDAATINRWVEGFMKGIEKKS